MPLKVCKSGGSTATYIWDFENRLTSATVNGATASFKYDPFGRRVYKSSSGAYHVYVGVYPERSRRDGDNLIEELNLSGTEVAHFTPGPGIDEPLAELRSGTTSFYQADGLGSITSLSNSSGALANTYVYDSFGNLTASTGSVTNPSQFTAREFDSETGLYYYRARYYDPTVGRFLSEDPISFGGGNDFYTYVQNSATNFSDPLGLLPCLDKCAELLKKIINIRNEIPKRLNEYANPKWNLPLLGNMSRQSHLEKIETLQKNLRDRLQEYNDLHCPDPVPVDSWRLGTMRLPDLAPSPQGLPPLPMLCATCGLAIGAGQWAVQHPGTTITILAVGTAIVLVPEAAPVLLAF